MEPLWFRLAVARKKLIDCLDSLPHDSREHDEADAALLTFDICFPHQGGRVNQGFDSCKTSVSSLPRVVITRAVPVVPPVSSITLELTPKQAQALASFLYFGRWPNIPTPLPDDSPAKLLNSIYTPLALVLNREGLAPVTSSSQW